MKKLQPSSNVDTTASDHPGELAQLSQQALLLSLNTDIASTFDKKDLLKKIQPKLRQLFNTEDIFICTFDKTSETLNPFLRVAGTSRHNNPVYQDVLSSHFPVGDGFIDRILSDNKPVIFDLQEVDRWKDPPYYIGTLTTAGLKASLSRTLFHGNEPIGILTFWSESRDAFLDAHMQLINYVADQLSLAVINIRAYEAIHQRERENETLLLLSNEIASVRNKQDLTRIVSTSLKRYVPFDDAAIIIYNQAKDVFNVYLYDATKKRSEHPLIQQLLNADYPFHDNNLSNPHTPVVLDLEVLANNGSKAVAFIRQNGICEIASIKLVDGDRLVGLFVLLAENKNTFSKSSLYIMQRISYQVSIAVVKLLVYDELKNREREKDLLLTRIEHQLQEINQYKEKLEEEKLYLQEELGSNVMQGEIVGASEAMKAVCRLISQVASANSTVLVLGETGTGKELVARAIHRASTRRENLLVKVNCASIPATLIESELFGHEKGAFTGATERRIGKFEIAGNGTLFLDEIGELSKDLQAKLLRAIQEKEIERVGGKDVIRTDVRIIAATNRDLEREVGEGNFRSDLYYRLNVFPITIPPLRERKEDIPTLASYFMKKFSKTTGKKINGISNKALKDLQQYYWPGNVRELEHLIERSVLMAQRDIITDVHLPARHPHAPQGERSLKTYSENERDHILHVLEKCQGKIYGSGGAAAVLGLKVSTLNSKIRKLGIKKTNPFTEE